MKNIKIYDLARVKNLFTLKNPITVVRPVMVKKLVMLCVVSASCLTTPIFAAETAKLTINKNNIKVWTIQNSHNSMLSYRAETTFNTTLERAVAIVLDVENAQQWMPNVASTEVLSQDLEHGEFKLYMVLDFPFPLKDRDLIIQGKISKNANGTIQIKNKVSQQGKAINPDYIRLQKYQGDWTFSRLADGKIKVITTGYADPEGIIPQSVSNMFVQQQPYQLLQKMKLELAKPNRKFINLPNILK